MTDFPQAARSIVRGFAADYEFGPHSGQEALARRLGYAGRETVSYWFRGLDSGRTDRQTTPPLDARRKLWAVMEATDSGMLSAVATLAPSLRREVAETRRMIEAGAYADAAAPYVWPEDDAAEPARQLREAA